VALSSPLFLRPATPISASPSSRTVCADLDADLHGTLMEKLFPLRAAVLSAADFLKLEPVE
jgi:hypothetical protein